MPESDDLMTEIVRLQRQVSALAEVVQNLFTLVKSTQRTEDAQEEAFKKIPTLIEQVKNPDA